MKKDGTTDKFLDRERIYGLGLFGHGMRHADPILARASITRLAPRIPLLFRTSGMQRQSRCGSSVCRMCARRTFLGNSILEIRKEHSPNEAGR